METPNGAKLLRTANQIKIKKIKAAWAIEKISIRGPLNDWITVIRTKIGTWERHSTNLKNDWNLWLERS